MPRVRPGEASPVSPGTTYYRLVINGGASDHFFICDTPTTGELTFHVRPTITANTATTSGSWVSSSGSSTYNITYDYRTIACPAPEPEPLTEEQRQERCAATHRRAAERERRRRERLAAEAKAQQLLRLLLTEEQRTQLTTAGGFHVTVRGGNVYEIDCESTIGNVYLLGDRGQRVVKYCIHPADEDAIPRSDTHVAQLLALQSDEQEFLRVANVHWDHRGREEGRGQRPVPRQAAPLPLPAEPLVLDVAGDPATVEAFTAEMHRAEDIGLGTVEDLDSGQIVPVTEEFTDIDEAEFLAAEADACVAEAVQRLEERTERFTQVVEAMAQRIENRALAS